MFRLLLLLSVSLSCLSVRLEPDEILADLSLSQTVNTTSTQFPEHTS